MLGNTGWDLLQIAAFTGHFKLHNAWLNILTYKDLGPTNGTLISSSSGCYEQSLASITLTFFLRWTERKE